MNSKELCKYFDHTILKPNATRKDVHEICEEAIQHEFFSVCVNGYWLPQVKEWLQGTNVKSVAVLGFPLGAQLTKTKMSEAKQLMELGADELDMVINIGEYLAGERSAVAEDVAAVQSVCGKVPLKVIIETAFHEEEQIRDLTRLCMETGVAFIKTSTGFAHKGANEDDVRAMRDEIELAGNTHLQIKASGGIRSLEDFEKMVAAGANRIGASASVGILQEFNDRG